MSITRIFISSPSDVTAERLRLERVIARLAGELTDGAGIEAYRWEHQYYTAASSFQDQIPPPSASDLVVCMFWKRLGSELPPQYARPDGSIPSGSEYEFEDAIQAARDRGTPDVLVYRKTAEVLYSAAGFDQERAQHDAFLRFWSRWFQDGSGHFTAASHGFETTDGFEAMVEAHLRQWLRQRHLLGNHAAVWSIARQGSPFRGLKAFDAAHEAVFFGRRRVVEQLRERLAEAVQRDGGRGAGFLLILGGSGAGKSSLARAGLLPRLLRPGAIASVDLCRRCVVRPGEAADGAATAAAVGPGGQAPDPLAGLAQALFAADALPDLIEGDSNTPAALTALFRAAPQAGARAVSRTIERMAAALAVREGYDRRVEVRLLLLVDQFEELLAMPADTVTGYAAVLAELVASRVVWIVCTMRSDFYAAFQAVPTLVALKQEGVQFDLLPPAGADIADVINSPAAAAGLRYGRRPGGAGLDEELLAAAASPGSLPLLQFALDELFNARDRATDTLTVAAYDGFGGLAGVIERRAEATFATLPAAAQAALPMLLRSLVTLSADDLPVARAAELPRPAHDGPAHDGPADDAPNDGGRADPLAALVEAFTAARLLVADGRQFRLAHEALIARWPRARAIMAEDREFLRTRARIEAAAALWQREARHPDYLLQGGRPLAEAADIRVRRPDAITAALLGFIDASLAAERTRRRRGQRRRTVGLAAGFAALLVVALLAFSVRQDRQEAALVRARNDEERALAALLRADPAEAEMLLARAVAVDDRVETRELLQSARAQAAPVSWTVPAVPAGDRVAVLAISADGRYALRGGPGEGGADGGAGGGADAGLAIWRLAGDAPRLVRAIAAGAGVTAAGFSADAARLVIARGDAVELWSAGADGSSWLPGAAEPERVLRVNHPVQAIAFSPDGRRLAFGTRDHLVCVLAIDAPAGADPCSLAGHTDQVHAVAFTPEGGLVSASRDNTLRIWDLATGRTRATLAGHDDAVLAVAVSPDGATIASGGWDDRIMLWDRPSGRRIRVLVGHRGGIRGLAFAPDSRTLLSGSEDATARLWDAQTGLLTLTLHASAGAEVRQVAFSARDGGAAGGGGREAVLGDTAGLLRGWNTDAIGERAELSTWRGFTRPVAGAAFAPGGGLLAAGSWDRSIHLVDPSGHAPGQIWPAHEAAITAVALSRDGHWLASASKDGTARVFALPADGRPGAMPTPIVLAHRAQGVAPAASDPGAADGAGAVIAVRDLAFAPRGDVLATAADDGGLRLWHLPDGKLLRVVSTPVQALGVAYSPDGGMLALAGQDGGIRLIDPDGGIRRVLAGHAGAVWQVVFAPPVAGEPALLLSASDDSTTRLWDVERGTQLGAPLRHDAPLWSVAISRDARTIATAGQDGSVAIWRIDPAATAAAPPASRIWSLRVTDAPVWYVAYSPADDGLAIAGADDTLRVWRQDRLVARLAQPGAVAADAARQNGMVIAATPEAVPIAIAAATAVGAPVGRDPLITAGTR